ncbi:amidohydrolase family protein [Sphingomonas crocodyli]|uniref:Amidohydrolase-related domain-containing protein n=1 Tax=Sphingomonas crocodyli TaxID=1979270 RepID=A0A437M480_9SPHN|nr:amidohydrolase family protein [Sphingomonas crocodyli]RVT92406.1 hypothetical protein EOD43_00235 [Sphingomonas crocodyli]
MMKVIDCHHHVGSVKDTLGLGGASGGGEADAELRIRIETMATNGVDQAIVIPGHGYIRAEGIADTRRINDAIAAYRDADRAHFPAAIGIVEPLYGAAGLDEVDRIHAELGLAGVSFHTRYQGVPNDSPLIRKLIERMERHRLIPFVHALPELSDEAPWRVASIARDFPDLPFVVLDAFASYEQSQQVMFLADLAPNLIFDTGLLYTLDIVMPFIRRFGAKRLVYGSDLYSHPLGYRHEHHVLTQLRKADLKDAERGLILSGNIERILGLI